MAAGEGQVIGCHTMESWNENLRKGSDSQKLIVVDFTASWCGPCRFMAPIFEELARKKPDAIFLKVDVDELPAVAEEWEVEAMPSFILLKGGKLVDRVVGASKNALVNLVDKYASPPVVSA
ncbi:hypothetical protein MLD38_002111 [Melastoma candidum]|uniref:Uncharacterized protein n=1 Tax=Melastoma candidum TaxID=119954 RepID=A0ACB9SP07_9MYRT|nr:hypothetical protein MLD38_002111 [Melastoma candidum]